MNTQRIVIGAHGFFCRNGDAFLLPAPGTISRTSKPGATDLKWLDLGEADHVISPNSSEVEFYAPAPGARMLKDIITTKRGLKIKSKFFEVSNLIFQMMWGSLNAPDSGAIGQYNPLEAEHRVKGWLKLQQYKQDHALFNIVDVYVSGKLTGDVAGGDAPVDFDVEWDVLYSTLNTGTSTLNG